jgi:hypothetical protein
MNKGAYSCTTQPERSAQLWSRSCTNAKRNTQKPSPKHQCSEMGIEPAERDRAKWRGDRGRGGSEGALGLMKSLGFGTESWRPGTWASCQKPDLKGCQRMPRSTLNSRQIESKFFFSFLELLLLLYFLSNINV